MIIGQGKPVRSWNGMSLQKAIFYRFHLVRREKDGKNIFSENSFKSVDK